MSVITPNAYEFNSDKLVTPVLKLEALTFSLVPGSPPMATPDKNQRRRLEHAISAFLLKASSTDKDK